MPKLRATLTDLYPLTEQLVEFGFRLLWAMVEESGRNVLLSPYSVAAALALVEEGAAGETREEITRVAGLGGIPREVVRENIGALLEILQSRSARHAFRVANALWLDEMIPIEPAYLSVVRDELLAEIHQANFREIDMAARINAWVSRKTDGFIPSIVDHVEGGICLTNALYFCGRWEKPFQAEETRTLPFDVPERQPINVPFMSGSGDYPYHETRQYQVIRLEYQGSEIAMDVVLPRKGSVSDLMGGRNGAFWKEVSASLRSSQGNLRLPKFSTNCPTRLEEVLQRIGIRAAFTSRADFSPMTSMRPTFIERVLHRVRVDVDEAGTEAAAATLIEIMPGMARFSAPKKRFEMVVDRPFLFLIHHMTTRCPLFLGIITNPVGE